MCRNMYVRKQLAILSMWSPRRFLVILYPHCAIVDNTDKSMTQVNHSLFIACVKISLSTAASGVCQSGGWSTFLDL